MKSRLRFPGLAVAVYVAWQVTLIHAQQNPAGVDLTPELAIDEQSLSKATERGAAMLKGAKWATPVPIAGLAGGNAAVKQFDAGDSVIWWPSEFAAGVSADKATGKPMEGAIRLIAAGMGDKVGEMVVDQSFSERGSGTAYWIALEGVVNRTTRWQVEAAPYTDSALLVGKQIFTGASVPGMKRTPLPRGATALPVTSTTLTLQIASHDRDSGKKRWGYTLPAGTLTAKPFAFADGVVYILSRLGAEGRGGTQKDMFIGIDSTDGKEIFNVLVTDVSPMAVSGGELVASTSTGELVGFDGKTGNEKWRERISVSKEPGRVTLNAQSDRDETPVVAGDKILVRANGRTDPPSIDGNSRHWNNYMTGVAAFDAKTHKQVWFFRPPEDKGGNGQSARQLMLTGVQAEGDRMVALAYGSELAYVGVDLRNGKLDWYLPTSSLNNNNLMVKTKPVISGGVVYVVKDSQLMALPLAGM